MINISIFCVIHAHKSLNTSVKYEFRPSSSTEIIRE